MTCLTYLVTCVTFVNITFRGIDKKKYLEFKSVAVKSELSVGVALNEAITKWLNENKKETKIDPNDPFFQLIENPVDWGVDTDAANADKYIYQ